MEFLGFGIGQLLLNELANAVSVDIAVAFFNPRQDVEIALGVLPKLRLVVSEEYTITNPESLERLKNATIRTAPTDHDDGKLHAKVVVSRRADGTKWALLGSANITRSGLFSNQEACIQLVDTFPDDAKAIADIEKWFEKVFRAGRDFDLEEAKQIRLAQSAYKLVRRSPGMPSPPQYWTIKTTVGSLGKSHWTDFQKEKVVAIGWEKIDADPSQLDDEELYAIIAKTYPELNPHHALKTIRDFIRIPDDTIFLICKGYGGAHQKKPVAIYGFARVVGGFRFDTKSNWWKFKRDVAIQDILSSIDRNSISEALGKGTLMETLQRVDRDGFEAVAKELGKLVLI